MTDSRPSVRVFPDREAIAEAAASTVAATAAAAVRSRGRFHLALAGGSTPLGLYERLAAAGLDLASWHLWWGDERFVASDDAKSNYRMAREALLERVTIDAARVHRVETEAGGPDAVAARYARTMAEAEGLVTAGLPRFDLVLLGMGADGHTASLFPGTAALDESQRTVVAGRVPRLDAVRITVTIPVLNAARAVLFLVAGADKAATVARVLEGGGRGIPLPAARVRPTAGEVSWFLDRDAASELGKC